jgi:two-component system, OmpR family, response regulator QseB
VHILLVGVSDADGSQEVLAHDHYHLSVVVDVPAALGRLADSRVDLVILEDAYDDATRAVARALRASTARLLVVRPGATAQDRAAALDAGADDCITSPAEAVELRARVRALLRRDHAGFRGALLEYGPLTLDPRSHRVRLHGAALDLSATEYRLARCLLLHAEAVVTRDQLNQEVWGGSLDRRSNAPDVYISYLRRHLAGRAGALIRTVRGVGYTLSLEQPASGSGQRTASS